MVAGAWENFLSFSTRKKNYQYLVPYHSSTGTDKLSIVLSLHNVLKALAKEIPS
jgi:hypothetical protein